MYYVHSLLTILVLVVVGTSIIDSGSTIEIVSLNKHVKIIEIYTKSDLNFNLHFHI